MDMDMPFAEFAEKHLKAPEGSKSAVERLVGLRWSKEPPTAPGWYWSKDHHGVSRVVQVHAHPELPEVMTLLENTYMGWRYVRIPNRGREWAGPIPTPEAR